jgi:chromosome segregation ATPase
MADIHDIEARIENLKKKRNRAEFEMEQAKEEVKTIVAQLKALGLTSAAEIDDEIEKLDQLIAEERQEIDRLLTEAGV